MPMSVQELLAESRKLPPEQSAELMDLLLSETFVAPDATVEEAWSRETDRRLAELENGSVPSVPAEQVMAELRKKLGG